MKFLIFALCVSLVFAVPLQPTQSDPIDDFLKQILELIREMMKTGNPDFGIPVLDPFEVPPFDDIHIE